MDGSIINVESAYVPKGGTMVGEDGGEVVQDYDAVENAHAHANCHCWLFPAKTKKVNGNFNHAKARHHEANI